jgi:large subunit ribosomal protein L24
MKIHKEDTVQIMLGKDRGKSGRVLRVLGSESKILVEGVNTFKRHVKKMQNIEGGIVDITKPVNISNVMIVCPNCKKLTRVGYKITDGEKSRICKKCQKPLKESKGK